MYMGWKFCNDLYCTDITTAAGAVAFSAYTIDDTRYYPYDPLVFFPGILTNIGNHYANSTFTCPVNGVYLFTLTYKAYEYHPAFLDIKVSF